MLPSGAVSTLGLMALSMVFERVWGVEGAALPLSHALFRAFSTFQLCLPRRHFSMVISRWGCPGVFAWVPSHFLFVGGLLRPIFLKDYSAACAQPMASMLANIC